MTASILNLRGGYAAGAAVTGLALLVVGMISGSADALHGYLGAALAFVAVPLGSLILLYMMEVIGGAWREVLGPTARIVTSLLPAAALAFVPVLLDILAGAWGGAPDAHWTPFKTFYLQPGFVVLRAVGYFGLWLCLRARLFAPRVSAGAAAVALIALTLTVSLAAIDWAMAVDRDFASSIYGLIFLAHVVLSGLAATIALYGRMHDKALPMLGALLIAVLLIWAYMHAMQFMIVWAGDRPDEIRWYIARSAGVWRGVLWAISVGGFVLPFAALLSPERRSSPAAAGSIAAIVFVALILEAFWLVLPGHITQVLPASLGVIGGLLICGGLAAMTLAQALPLKPQVAL